MQALESYIYQQEFNCCLFEFECAKAEYSRLLKTYHQEDMYNYYLKEADNENILPDKFYKNGFIFPQTIDEGLIDKAKELGKKAIEGGKELVKKGANKIKNAAQAVVEKFKELKQKFGAKVANLLKKLTDNLIKFGTKQISIPSQNTKQNDKKETEKDNSSQKKCSVIDWILTFFAYIINNKITFGKLSTNFVSIVKNIWNLVKTNQHTTEIKKMMETIKAKVKKGEIKESINNKINESSIIELLLEAGGSVHITKSDYMTFNKNDSNFITKTIKDNEDLSIDTNDKKKNEEHLEELYKLICQKHQIEHICSAEDGSKVNNGGGDQELPKDSYCNIDYKNGQPEHYKMEIDTSTTPAKIKTWQSSSTTPKPDPKKVIYYTDYKKIFTIINAQTEEYAKKCIKYYILGKTSNDDNDYYNRDEDILHKTKEGVEISHDGGWSGLGTDTAIFGALAIALGISGGAIGPAIILTILSPIFIVGPTKIVYFLIKVIITKIPGFFKKLGDIGNEMEQSGLHTTP